MFQLNDKVKNLTPYEPISGTYEIRLDANESFLTVPKNIENEMVEALKNSALNRYPDPNATKLVKGFADYFNVDADCVTAGNGSDEIISVIMNAFLQKGDKILTLEPDFSMYRFYAEIAECESVKYQKDQNLDVNIDDVIALANNENVRIVIFSNPCNPTSRIITKDDVRKLINSTDALVVLDEAYMDFAEDESLLGEFENYDNLIILKTCSKALGCAALRLGFAVANKTLTNVIRAVKSPYNVNTVTQKIGELIYNNKEFLQNRRNTIVTLRESLYNDLEEIEKENPDKLSLVSGYSNFIFIKTPLSKEIFDFFLSKGVAIRLMNDYLRITAGTENENKAVIKLLNEFFN